MRKLCVLTFITLTLLQSAAIGMEASASKKNKRSVVAANTVSTETSSATSAEVLAAASPSKDPQFAEFDSNFLIGAASKTVDLSHFSVASAIASGNYRVDISLNQRFLGSFDLQVKAASGTHESLVCIPTQALKRMNVLPQHWSPTARTLLNLPNKDLPNADTNKTISDCQVIEDLVPGSKLSFDPGNLRVDITVPQAYMARTPRGYAPPDTWDEGITAGRLKYFYNYYQTEGQNSAAIKSQHLSLDSGINIGGWQLRGSTSLSMSAGQNLQRYNYNTYVRRNLPDLQANVTVGDTFSTSTLFTGYSVRGVQLASDMRMRPDSQNGFAPVLRGQAMTNARVEVRLNGQMIYSTNVTPGPFVIDDIYATGYGGDLVMTIIEADGSRRETLVPYAGSPLLVREGVFDYSLAIGQLRASSALASNPQILQGEASYGLNNTLTLRSGAQLSNNYQATAFGSALGTAWGAFGLTYTSARATFTDQPTQVGTSTQASWAKQIASTGTTLSLASYRYSTEHFYTLSDAQNEANKNNYTPNFTTPSTTSITNTILRERSRAVASFSQYMGTAGSIYLQTNAINYWNSAQTNKSIQLGYSRNIGPVGLSFSVQREQSALLQASGKLTRYSLSINVPLDSMGLSTGFVTSQATYDRNHGTTQSATFQSSLGENSATSYSITTQRDPSGSANYASGFTRTSVGSYSLTAGQSSNSTQVGLSAYGGMVFHPGGITLAPDLGETVGIVYIEGHEDGVKLNRFVGAAPDSNGYSVATYLSPFRTNQYELDLSEAAHDIEMETTQQASVPIAGAIVASTFKKQPGNTLLFKLVQENGEPVPFGANVKDAKDQTVGFVGQASKVEVRLVNYSGELKVLWGQANNESCRISYNLPEGTRRADRKIIEMLCKPTPESGHPIQQAKQVGLLAPAKDSGPSQQPVAR